MARSEAVREQSMHLVAERGGWHPGLPAPAPDEQQPAREREDYIPTVGFAELLQAEAEAIAWEMSARPDLGPVPGVVQDFLYGPWALVLAHARLAARSGEADPGGYHAVIADLLWSVQRDVTLRSPAQLLKRLPPMLEKLREGLSLLGDPPEVHEPFFQGLMKLHRPVLQLRRARFRRIAAGPGPASLAAEQVQRDSAAAARSSRLADVFEDTMPTHLAHLLPEALDDDGAAPPVAEAGLSAEEVSGIMQALQEGRWVALYSGTRWFRAKVTWVSREATLFLFVSEGRRQHSMTRRICERLIREGHLTPAS